MSINLPPMKNRRKIRWGLQILPPDHWLVPDELNYFQELELAPRRMYMEGWDQSSFDNVLNTLETASCMFQSTFQKET